jgi:hypothetical protein
MNSATQNNDRTEHAMSTNKIAARIINRNAAKAQAAYDAAQADAETQLRRIEAAMKHFGAGERKDYAHVGSMTHLASVLKDAADFINNTEEE